jgi:hypothetical protein
MARRKGTPDRSTIRREPTIALSSRKRGDDEPQADAKPEPKPDDAKRVDSKSDDTAPLVMKPGDKKADSKDETEPLPAALRAPATADSHSGETEPYDRQDLDPDATPAPMSPVASNRARTETELMPESNIGRPPEMPHSVAPPPLALGTVEEPTHMPGPKDIPSGEPGDRAPAPGYVPRGDSRSLRRGAEFALIYRITTYVISRFGTVGQRGQWRVVEYPTSSSASHSYAKECSRFVSEGFSDYRE